MKLHHLAPAEIVVGDVLPIRSEGRHSELRVIEVTHGRKTTTAWFEPESPEGPKVVFDSRELVPVLREEAP